MLFIKRKKLAPNICLASVLVLIVVYQFIYFHRSVPRLTHSIPPATIIINHVEDRGSPFVLLDNKLPNLSLLPASEENNIKIIPPPDDKVSYRRMNMLPEAQGSLIDSENDTLFSVDNNIPSSINHVTLHGVVTNPLAQDYLERDEHLEPLLKLLPENMSIDIVIMGRQYSDHAGELPCTFQGRKLRCEYFNYYDQPDDTELQEADATYYFSEDSYSAIRPRGHPSQPRILMTAESSAYYPAIEDPDMISKFDYFMTYKRDSDVWVAYEPFDVKLETAGCEKFKRSFKDKLPRVVFMNRNCSPLNGRTQLVQNLMSLGVPVDAVSACLNNAQPPSNDKIETFSHYRVCIAMENSDRIDYVSEKVWDAFRAHCVPIYQGAPNAREDFLPADNTVIWVKDYDQPEALAEQIMKVLTEEEEYNKYMRWRELPYDRLKEGYRRNIDVLRQRPEHSRCQMCQVLAKKKYLGAYIDNIAKAPNIIM